ncbi:MAG: hypothetical protein KA792_02635 [Bacteroidales bacterium]|nr:hypothetical protein [Bacteroidales bacterium]
MKKIVLTLILLSSMTFCFGQKSNKFFKDTLIWNSKNLLTKEDFLAKKTGTKFTYTFHTAIYFYSKEIEGDLKVKVEAVFLKSKSLMKENSQYALKHAQIFFNLTELYARKLRKTILETDFLKVKDIVNKLGKLYSKANDELNKEKERMSNDTQHGLNAAKLEKWNQEIQNQLDELNDFSSTIIDINRSK